MAVIVDHAPVASLEAPQAFVEGPAFSPGVKILSSLLMLALTGYGIDTLPALRTQPWSVSGLAFIGVTLACLWICYFWILRSRTTITDTHIRQTWFSPREVALADITQIKLIHIPHLAWLISPRMVVRSRGPARAVFYIADPRLLEAVARLALGLKPVA
jgi:hypothetical protein